MRYALYAVAAFLAVSILITITTIGKPRKPVTGGVAAASVAIFAAIITVLILAAGRL